MFWDLNILGYDMFVVRWWVGVDKRDKGLRSGCAEINVFHELRQCVVLDVYKKYMDGIAGYAERYRG